MAERGYLEAREDVAGNTADAFFNLYAQQMTLANATANVAVNDTLYTLNKGRFEVGKIGENDLLKSELALLRARAAVDDAQLARDRAEAALRRIIAYPDGQPLSIVTPDSIPIVDADPDVAVKRGAQELEHRWSRTSSTTCNAQREIIGAKLEQPLQRDDLGERRASTRPRRRSARRIRVRSASSRSTVGVNLPMLQWGAGRADVEARASRRAARRRRTTRSRRDALVEDARFSALQLQQAQRNVLISAKADTVADKQFEVARNRYIIGKISNTDLYTAQRRRTTRSSRTCRRCGTTGPRTTICAA